MTSVLSAKMGYFNYFGGLAAAFAGAYAKDWIKFLIVKKKGNQLLAKKTKLKTKIYQASGWFEKRPFFYLCTYRLLYGFSTIILLLSGLRQVSYARFALASAVSVGLWIAVIGGLGYFCAALMLEQLNWLGNHKLLFIGLLTTIGLVYWLLRRRPHEQYCFTEAATWNEESV